MRPLVVIGLVLVILGVLALGYQGVAWVTTRDTVAQGDFFGNVFSVKADRSHPIPLGPVLGVVLIVGGAVCMATGASRRGT